MRSPIILLVAAFVIGCNSSAQQVQNTASPVPESQRSEKPQTMTAHTTENQTPKPANTGVPSAPYKSAAMGEPIDTAKFDGTIAAAEKIVKSKPADEAARKTLADAYFDRGFALTEARQYASALGDYRRALKLDPNHEESKKWLDQIVSIYGMLKKNAPKEGEEPPPLPFKKAS